MNRPHNGSRLRLSPSEELLGEVSRPDSNIEQALLDILYLLIRTDEVDLSEVLRRFGKAVGSSQLTLYVLARRHPANQLSLFDNGVEHPQEAAPHSSEALGGEVEVEIKRVFEKKEQLLEEILPRRSSGLVIPIISPARKLHGYLDIAYPARRGDVVEGNSRSLHYLSNLLAGYFDREAGRSSVRENEEHLHELAEAHPEPMLIRDEKRILYANQAARELLGARADEKVAGRLVHDFVSAELYDALDVQWDRLRSRNQLTESFEHEIIRLDGKERIVKSFYLPLIYEGREAAQVVMRDLTEQRKSEERYRRFVETISEAIWCFEIAPALPAHDDTTAQVEHVWEQAHLVECNDVMAHLLGASTVDAVVGTPLQELFGSSIKELLTDFIQAGYQLHNHEYVVEQADGEARHFVVNAVGTKRRGQLVQVWGSCVEVTERIRLEQRMVEALESQQNRIGRDLHDGAGQLLTSVRMLAENLIRRFSDEEEEYKAMARRMERLAKQAYEQVRTIHQGLSANHLRDVSLPDALSGLVEDTNVLSEDVRCTFSSEGTCEVEDDDVKQQLYRITQEALNNAVKHAQAQNIWVTLSRQEDGLRLHVEDDGTGFKPNVSGENRSLGLHSMRYRARSLGGELQIESTSGTGTAVTCTVPV